MRTLVLALTLVAASASAQTPTQYGIPDLDAAIEERSLMIACSALHHENSSTMNALFWRDTRVLWVAAHRSLDEAHNREFLANIDYLRELVRDVFKTASLISHNQHVPDPYYGDDDAISTDDWRSIRWILGHGAIVAADCN